MAQLQVVFNLRKFKSAMITALGHARPREVQVRIVLPDVHELIVIFEMHFVVPPRRGNVPFQSFTGSRRLSQRDEREGSTVCKW